MEDFVHDVPLPVDFKQREQIGVPVTGPVVEFKSPSGDRANDVDAGDPCLEPGRWTVVVIPRKEWLDGAGEQVGTAKPKIVASSWKASLMSSPLPDLAPSM